MKYLVRHGTRVSEIEADDLEAASLEAARTTSVAQLRDGVEFEIYPLGFAQTRKVQYERPNATTGRHERFPDYGKPQIVDEFQETPPSPFFSEHAKPKGAMEDKR